MHLSFEHSITHFILDGILMFRMMFILNSLTPQLFITSSQKTFPRACHVQVVGKKIENEVNTHILLQELNDVPRLFYKEE